MLLEITTYHTPATDLGFLLNKHPDRLQSIDLSVGKAHIFYPVATETACTACLLLDINPIDLIRTRGQGSFLQEHYVNDRPYTSNSFLSTAIVKAFGATMNGTAKGKPELADTSIPLVLTVYSLKVNCSVEFLHRLFEPLECEIQVEVLPLDEKNLSWGQAKVVNITVEKNAKLKELLSQLYVLILALDNDRHYWISKGDIEVLLKRGAGWLESHPEKDWITKRFLKNLKTLTSEAFLRLAGTEDNEESELVAPSVYISLHEKRLQKVSELIKESGAVSVLDAGCGEGKLIRKLIKESQFRKITGMDVSFSQLQKAKENLYLDSASPLMRERVSLFQGSVTYKDDRMKGFDAIALVEVIEHIDKERLPAMEKVIFGNAAPGAVIVSTPNSEYNIVFGKLDAAQFRHDDHRFEWSREEFRNWCRKVCGDFSYAVEIHSVGEEEKEIGAPSQLAVFKKQER